MTDPIYTGGCQCGAVRFRVEGVLTDSSICHCRMCQKAFGAYYAPLVSTRGAELTWTRGQPKTFRSSNFASRGFCEHCGTPLTYEAPDGIAIAAGACDDPTLLPPVSTAPATPPIAAPTAVFLSRADILEQPAVANAASAITNNTDFFIPFIAFLSE